MVGNRRRLRRAAYAFGLAAGVLLLLLLLSLAIPIRTWRTGELPAVPLSLVDGGPAVPMTRRVWIDTDAACGQGRMTDPDDCLALVLLLRAADVDVIGISTVHGNAPLAVTNATARALVAELAAEGIDAPPVYLGAARPEAIDAATPARDALRRSLAAEPMTIVALGPLTNIAAALNGQPALQRNVARLVTVMGRRPGHIFHPAEGEGHGGILFGHGPVFTDFNFAQDRTAAAQVLAMHLPVSLLPYDAAREFSLTANELSHLRATGGATAWVADRARGWLEFWQQDIGRPGFYPFDLVAAGYILAPQFYDCANARAWTGEDESLWSLFDAPEALLVEPPLAQNREQAGPDAPAADTGASDETPDNETRDDDELANLRPTDGLTQTDPEDPAQAPAGLPPDSAQSAAAVVYCSQLDPRLKPWLMAQLTAP